MSAQHRVLLRHILAHLDFLDGQPGKLGGLREIQQRQSCACENDATELIRREQDVVFRSQLDVPRQRGIASIDHEGPGCCGPTEIRHGEERANLAPG
jgi:hypothetical protein